jgi:hypothetical protein
MTGRLRWIPALIGAVIVVGACTPAPEALAVRATIECAGEPPESDLPDEDAGDDADPEDGDPDDESPTAVGEIDPLSPIETFFAVVDAVDDQGDQVEVVTADEEGNIEVVSVADESVGETVSDVATDSEVDLVAVGAVQPVSALETNDRTTPTNGPTTCSTFRKRGRRRSDAE